MSDFVIVHCNDNERAIVDCDQIKTVLFFEQKKEHVLRIIFIQRDSIDIKDKNKEYIKKLFYQIFERLDKK